MSGEDSYQVIKHGTIILHKTCRCFPQKRKKWSPWVHVPYPFHKILRREYNGAFLITQNMDIKIIWLMWYGIRRRGTWEMGLRIERFLSKYEDWSLHDPQRSWAARWLPVIPALWRQTFGIREPCWLATLARTGELCVWRGLALSNREWGRRHLMSTSGVRVLVLVPWNLAFLKRLGLLESWCVLHPWYTWDTMNLGPPCVTLLDFPPADFIPFYDGFLLTLSHFPLWELHIRSCTS